MTPLAWAVALIALLHGATANVEKSIFIAPAALSTPEDASIDNLYLIPLTPLHSTARTRLNATFPTELDPRGTVTWMLLDGLEPGTRYEVRICWLATQPTEFSLYTHTIAETFEDPVLVSSLSSFSYARHAQLDGLEVQQLQSRRVMSDPLIPESRSQSQSMLFLQIFAAADYFSLNRTLMETVPPVLVDVILDPYMLNIFPRSLLPTALYIVILAVGAWFLSGYTWRYLADLASPEETVSNRENINVAEEKKTR